MYLRPEKQSGSGTEESQRKVKGTLHWVSRKHCIDIDVNEYDRLFHHENPSSAQTDEELLKMVNPGSIKKTTAKAEPFLSSAKKDKVSVSKKRLFRCRQL